MKKLIIIAFLCAFAISFGQEKEKRLSIEKGTWNIDGSVSIYTTKSDLDDEFYIGGSDRTNLSFYPSVGYTIKDNLIIGIGIGYGYSDYNAEYIDTGSDNGQSRNSNKYSVNAFVKKFIPLKGNFALIFLGELGYSNLKEEDNRWNFDDIRTTNTTTNSVFIGIRPGITYFLSEHFALEGKFGTLRYQSSKSELDNDLRKSKSNSFYFNLNPSNIYLGLSYYF